MKRVAMIAMALSAGLGLAGCMSDEVARTDGVTSTAGDSIAANTVMQMVDPWPAGVQDTDLRVPAARASNAGGGSDSGTGTGVSGGGIE